MAKQLYGAQKNKKFAVEQLTRRIQTLFHSNRLHDLVRQYSFDDDLVQAQTLHL